MASDPGAASSSADRPAGTGGADADSMVVPPLEMGVPGGGAAAVMGRAVPTTALSAAQESAGEGAITEAGATPAGGPPWPGLPVEPEVDAGDIDLSDGRREAGTEAPADWNGGLGAWDGDTGVWNPDADGWDENGSWGGDQAWDEGYEGGADQGQMWYEQVPGGWEGPAGEAGWYDQGYPDQYTTTYPRSRREALGAYEQESYGTTVMPHTWDEGAPPAPRPTRRTNGPWPELVMVAAVAVIIAAVILAVTTAKKAAQPGPQSSSTSVPGVARGGSPKPTKTSSPTTSAPVSSTRPPTTLPAKPTTTAVGAPPAARALPVTPALEQLLVQSWLATDPGGLGMGPKDVGGTVPDEVLYAEQRSSQVYWALAGFEPSATVLAEKTTAAGQYDLAQFQDTEYIFNWKDGSALWNELGWVSTGACPGDYVPSSVLAAWGLCGLGQ